MSKSTSIVNSKHVWPPSASSRYVSLISKTWGDISVPVWQSQWHSVVLGHDHGFACCWHRSLYCNSRLTTFLSRTVSSLYSLLLQFPSKFQLWRQKISAGVTPFANLCKCLVLGILSSILHKIKKTPKQSLLILNPTTLISSRHYSH